MYLNIWQKLCTKNKLFIWILFFSCWTQTDILIWKTWQNYWKKVIFCIVWDNYKWTSQNRLSFGSCKLLVIKNKRSFWCEKYEKKYFQEVLNLLQMKLLKLALIWILFPLVWFEIKEYFWCESNEEMIWKTLGFNQMKNMRIFDISHVFTTSSSFESCSFLVLFKQIKYAYKKYKNKWLEKIIWSQMRHNHKWKPQN